MNIPVNPAAPVRSSSAVEIQAPASAVWRVVTGIDEWPRWQGDVTRARLAGPLAEGVEFRWKAGGIPFRSQVHTVVAHREFGWTGRTLGAYAVHNWRFNESEGVTLVQVEESLQGVFPWLFRSSFQKSLDEGMEKNLLELKGAVESGAGA